MCTPLLLVAGGGGGTSYQIFEKGLDRTSTFREGLVGKRGVFFQGGCNFYIKDKLKSKIFNDKKSL